MDTTERFSLWLLPDDTTSQTLSELMKQLRDRHGGPEFAPHITLFGLITGTEQELGSGLDKLAKQLDAFEVHTKSLWGKSDYFKCFFIQLNNSAELLRTRQLASDILAARMDSNYNPHISLLYGNQIRKHRAELVSELKDVIPEKITVDRLQLVKLDVSVANWQVINTCQMKS